VLTTPVTRVEFLLGKAAAIFLPAIGVSYLMFSIFVSPWPSCSTVSA